MAKIEIYSSPFCGFCFRAKDLLNKKGVAFEEIDVMMNPSRKAEMLQRSNGGRTVPQIFINDRHIGGCDDLFAVEAKGELDALLSAAT
ncbi:MAG: glutaredoxin 3 [Alphaproteobacteria bacterium]|nr:glutaredoxin 3 [Alphaproteobacteria bacterium]